MRARDMRRLSGCCGLRHYAALMPARTIKNMRQRIYPVDKRVRWRKDAHIDDMCTSTRERRHDNHRRQHPLDL